MFQFPAFASLSRCQVFAWRVAPFGDPGVMRLFAPNPGFSQLVTSFFASQSLGIHRLPFFYCLVSFNWKLKIESGKRFKRALRPFSIFNFPFSIKLVALTCSCFVQYVKDLFLIESGKRKVENEKNVFNFQFSIFNWKLWRISDSNRWPPACRAGALASWANPPS